MSEQPLAGARRLVVMRHARTEPGGETDELRELAQSGWDNAEEAGRWLADMGITPDGALVSSASRTRSTWAAMAEGGSFQVTPAYSESLYTASPEAALDLVRETRESTTALVVVGHNPTMAYLAQLLDDGSGEEDAGRAMAIGFPPCALAVFEVTGPWSSLELASARLVAFHVGGRPSRGAGPG